MKKLLSILLALTVLLSLGASAFAGNDDTPDGRWLCSDIDGSVTADTPAELKDDFHLYVNKDWFVNTPLPDGTLGYGTFEEMNDVLDERMLALIHDESLTGHDAELVHKLYRLASDWDYRDALGLEPAEKWMKAISSSLIIGGQC